MIQTQNYSHSETFTNKYAVSVTFPSESGPADFFFFWVQSGPADKRAGPQVAMAPVGQCSQFATAATECTGRSSPGCGFLSLLQPSRQRSTPGLLELIDFMFPSVAHDSVFSSEHVQCIHMHQTRRWVYTAILHLLQCTCKEVVNCKWRVTMCNRILWLRHEKRTRRSLCSNVM